MFGMGFGEILVIAVVALLFLGPEKLPQAAKKLSKGIRDIRRQTRELKDTLEEDNEFGEAILDLQSALRGEEPRRRPRPKPRGASDGTAGGAALAAGAAPAPSENASAGDATADSASEVIGPPAPPADMDATLGQTPARDDQESADRFEPVLAMPAGSVARGAASRDEQPASEGSAGSAVSVGDGGNEEPVGEPASGQASG